MLKESKGLPRWATELMEKHGATVPPAPKEFPEWLRKEMDEKPLWYIIRESKEVRTKHPYLLLDEVRREPGQLADLARNFGSEARRIALELRSRDIREVIFTGCGSAFFTAIHSQTIFERFTGMRCRAIESFELKHYFPEVDVSHTAVFAHSGTGGTIETRDAVAAAKNRGLFTVAITNTLQSPTQVMADDSINYETGQGCGPCINVVSTRIMMVTMFAIEMGLLLEHNVAWLKKLQSQLPDVAKVAQAIVDKQEQNIHALAKKHKDTASFFLLGTGPNWFSAREGTLKVEEESICVSKAYRPGDYVHDAISILNETNCTIAIAGNPVTTPRIADCLDTARAANSHTIAITIGDNQQLKDHADGHIHLEGSLDEYLTPIPLTLVFHLFGYYRGVARGFNPDTLRTDYLPNAKAWLTAFPIGTH